MSEFTDSYWSQISPIWNAFKKGKISLSLRDRLLKPLRDQLHKEMTEDEVLGSTERLLRAARKD